MTRQLALHYARSLARHGSIDPVKYYPSRELSVVYVENAKVACTAIKQALYPEFSYRKLGQDRFHEQLRTKAFLRPPSGSEGYLYFSIVRDPLQRLLSCHRDKILGTETIFSSRAQRLIFGLFAGVDPVRGKIDAVNFAKAVGTIPERLRDRHIASQHRVADAVLATQNNFLGKLENLAEDWAQLQVMADLPDLYQLNPTQSDPITQDQAIQDLREICQRVYRQDYDMLGYPMEWQK